MEMLSTAVVATSSNNYRETTVAGAASGSLEIDYKALKTEIFHQQTTPSPRHLSAQVVKTSKPAALVTATTAENPATMLGNAAVHPNRTDRNRTAHAKTATKTSNFAHKVSEIA